MFGAVFAHTTDMLIAAVTAGVMGLLLGGYWGFTRGFRSGYDTKQLVEKVRGYRHEQAGEDPVVSEHDGFRIIRHEPNGDGE